MLPQMMPLSWFVVFFLIFLGVSSVSIFLSLYTYDTKKTPVVFSMSSITLSW